MFELWILMVVGVVVAFILGMAKSKFADLAFGFIVFLAFLFIIIIKNPKNPIDK